MFIAFILSISFLIASITFMIVFENESNKNGVFYSRIGLLLSIVFFISLIVKNKFNEAEDLKSKKSKKELSIEQQFKFLQKKSYLINNTFIKRKLNKYILDSGLKDSIALYLPHLKYKLSEINKIEDYILLVHNKHENLNPEKSYNNCEFKKIHLELIKVLKNNIIVFVSRGISNDSTNYIITSIFDSKSNELTEIESNQCYDQRNFEGVFYSSDNELLYFANLDKCSLDLRSKCYFWKNIIDQLSYDSMSLFDLDEKATYLIDGKVYPSYRLFKYDELLNICVKPTIKVLL